MDSEKLRTYLREIIILDWVVNSDLYKNENGEQPQGNGDFFSVPPPILRVSVRTVNDKGSGASLYEEEKRMPPKIRVKKIHTVEEITI